MSRKAKRYPGKGKGKMSARKEQAIEEELEGMELAVGGPVMEDLDEREIAIDRSGFGRAIKKKQALEAFERRATGGFVGKNRVAIGRRGGPTELTVPFAQAAQRAANAYLIAYNRGEKLQLGSLLKKQGMKASVDPRRIIRADLVRQVRRLTIERKALKIMANKFKRHRMGPEEARKKLQAALRRNKEMSSSGYVNELD